MSDRLNVIALISGGKDSLFSLLHCVQNGHNVVALGNLCPPSQPLAGVADVFDLKITVQDRDPTFHGFRLVDHEDSDLNSFMYQTVGYSLIPLYATALQMPLFRQEITGTSVLQAQDYDASADHRDDDETEDLVPLLMKIISAHPEANAVSTGAILSTYQRTRVESIAIRLGLTPLSFLWQYPILPSPSYTSTPLQSSRPLRSDSLTGLLEDMASAGVDARIIKIASAGIPERVLFTNLANSLTQSRLLNGLAPFFEDDDEIGLRGAVLGEGGEYETLTLNGPKAIWKGGRIEIDESAIETLVEGGVTYAQFGKARVIPHDEVFNAPEDKGSDDQTGISNLVPIPGLLDPQFESVQLKLQGFETHSKEEVPAHQQTLVSTSASTVSSDTLLNGNVGPDLNISYTVSTSSITISNITSLSILAFLESRFQQPRSPTDDSTTSSCSSLTTTSLSIAATQFQTILSQLPTLLQHLTTEHNLPPLSTKHITSTILLLRSISDFALINPIYSQLWPTGFPNPPARVTIAAPLETNIQVSLSLVLDFCPSSQRQGLHVQGRSYWAPANIGPYSQAIVVPLIGRPRSTGRIGLDDEDDKEELEVQKLKLVHIAGQIPLVPCSMQVHPGPFLDSAILSLQHLWRVGQERGVDIWPWTVAYLAEDTSTNINNHATIAAEVWREAHLNPTWTVPQDDDDNNDETSDNENEDEIVDIWDLQHNRSLHNGFRSSNMSVGKHRRILPNHSLFDQAININTNTTTKPRSKSKHIPPFLAAEVIALPRNVSIEWWSHGIAGLSKSSSTTRPKPSWQSESFPWGTISCLTIASRSTTPTRHNPTLAPAVKFITYFPSSTSTSTISSDTLKSLPNTLSQLLTTLNRDNTSTTDESTEAKLAQGAAFITTTTSLSNSNKSIWDHFTSTPKSLGNVTTIIPCRRLFGRRKTSNTMDVGYGLEEIAVAFLLRVEIVRKVL